MKKRTILFPVLVLLAFLARPDLAFAQQKSDSLVTQSNIKDNTIFWRQGKLVQHRGGQLYELQDPVQYPNGVVVSPTGEVRLANGKTQTLKQKNAINPQGQVVLVADDVFTHATIKQHERKVVGDTETRILVVDGQIISAGKEKQKFTYPLAQEKRILLLEQMVKLLEQRTALLEANLTAAERRSIAAYHAGLEKQLTILNQQLQTLSSSGQ